MITTDEQGPATSRNVKRLGVAALIAGLLAFIPVLMAWFTSEELVLFAIIDVDPFSLWSGKDRAPGFFRPLIPMLAWAWSGLFGVSALAFHILSVALHLINSVLVGFIAMHFVRYLAPGDPLRWRGAAIASAALFWVWPSHSEPVGWIPGLTDVFAATWLLSSLLAYLAYRNSRGVLLLALSLLGYGAALCTKESAITLPGVIGIYELLRVCHQRQLRRENVVGSLAFGLVMIAYFLFRRWLMGVFLGGYGELEHTQFSWERLHWALAPNLSNAFFPVPMLHLHVRDMVIAAFFLAAGAALAIASKRGRSIVPAIAAAAGALVLFLPGINLPCGHITSGQRFAYIPSALAVISVVFTIANIVRSQRQFLITASAMILACSLALGLYNYNWYRAGKVSEQIMERMAKLPPARKIFVLATTGNYREAYIMPHSLGFAAQALLPNTPSREIPIATRVNYWTSDIRVRVTPEERDGHHGWMVRLTPDEDTADNQNRDTGDSQLEITAAPGTDWAIIRPEADGVFVSPNGYDPATDLVVYLDGSKWHEL